MVEIDLEIQGLIETQKEMERIVRDLRGDPFLMGMRDATLLVLRDAIINAPVDTGRLRASITPEVRWEGNKAIGVVGSNLLYAPFVELGTRPHFVPGKYIGEWANHKGFFEGMTSVSRNWGIFVSGKAQPFLEPAFLDNEEKIIAILGDTVGRIVEGDE